MVYTHRIICTFRLHASTVVYTHSHDDCRLSAPYKYTTQVDILPTIADLAGIPLPTGETPFDGVSMVPLLNAAGSNGGEGGAGTGVFVHGGAPTEKDAAFTQYVDEGKKYRETKDGDRYIVATERER